MPVVRTVLADLQTPVGAFLRIAHDARYSFLLESVEGGERVARYSFLGAEPEMVIRGRGRDTIIEDNTGSSRTLDGTRPPDFLRDHFRERRLARRAGLAPLAGGAVGYIAYEAARWFEPALGHGEPPAGHWDDAVWMMFRTILAFDRARQQILITSVVFTDEARGDRQHLNALYDEAVAKTERLEQILSGSIESRPLPRRPPIGHADTAFESNWTRENFEDAVRLIKEKIAAGDCYQVVLSQRFKKKVAADPFMIYRALRATNPSPYTYFFGLADETIIGASPEMLVRCRGRRLDYRPIAGTRRRGATEMEDQVLGREMRADEKEVAEHTMLVDLGRNDLGRVADYGSVQVDDLMNIERYSHVQHLVSSLRGRLREDLDRFDALASCFPAGTVTGAPKVRAMQIIRELEPEPRGVYAGAVLYADYADNLDSCIAIRTIVHNNGVASVQAGAGIVADSIPELEYQETLNKARGMMRAIEMAERGW